MLANTDETKLPELKQQAIEWLVLLRSDDMSEAETHAFADWLSQDILHAEAFAKAEDLFNAMIIAAQSPRVIAPVLVESKKPDNNTLSVTHRKQTKPTRRPSPKRYLCWLALPLALAAAWLFAVALVLPTQSHLLDDYLSDYHTNTGEQRDIQLADGSQILLNTNTAVSVDYQQSLRQITLHHGQARFTVAKDAQRPFEIKSGGLTVRALGTVFDVYQQESGDIDVTVQEHAVAARIQNEGANERGWTTNPS